MPPRLAKPSRWSERVDSVGGVCIHTGTIPSKAIREAVLHLTGLRERAVYGASYAVKQNISMSDLLYPLPARRPHRGGGHPQPEMHRNGVTMMFGSASFLDANTLRVTRGEEAADLRGRHILIAVGTVPARPASVPFSKGKVIDSNELLDLADLPRSLVIVGGV